MKKQNIIDSVIEKISNYSDIKFEKKNDRELRIFCFDDKGFDILLQTSRQENTLYLGNFHWHYENSEEDINEMLNQLILALTGTLRIKEFSKNRKAYKWTLQIRDRHGIWFDNETMEQVNFNFWTKAEIEYLQNNHYPKNAF